MRSPSPRALTALSASPTPTARLGHDELTIDGDIDDDGKADILITGDVGDDDLTVGATDITDILRLAVGPQARRRCAVIRPIEELTLEGLRLTGGVAEGNGGAVTGTTVALINSTVTGNFSEAAGGGVSATGVTLDRSTVSGNLSWDDGGGVHATLVTATNSTVSSNRADDEGGGIFAGGTAALTNVDAQWQLRPPEGSAILANTVNLTNSTVNGNSGSEDGAIKAVTAQLTNSLVLGNNTFSDDEAIATSLTLIGGNSSGKCVPRQCRFGDTSAAESLPVNSPTMAGLSRRSR